MADRTSGETTPSSPIASGMLDPMRSAHEWVQLNRQHEKKWSDPCHSLWVTAVVTVKAQTFLSGRVVGFMDGDTITLLDGSKMQHKAGLAGIDAPEEGQALGNRSKQSLSEPAFGKDASADSYKTDRCSRRVCKVTVGGVDVGLERIRLGMCWQFKPHEREQSAADRAVHALAEIEAQEAKPGLSWDARPLPP